MFGIWLMWQTWSPYSPYITEELFELMKMCWEVAPSDRPEVSILGDRISQIKKYQEGLVPESNYEPIYNKFN